MHKNNINGQRTGCTVVQIITIRNNKVKITAQLCYRIPWVYFNVKLYYK